MREKKNFNKYLVCVSVIIFLLTSCLGALVYNKMGSKIPKIYLQAMIHDFPVIKFLLTVYSIFLFLNYQYLLFPVYQIAVEERELFSTTFHVRLDCYSLVHQQVSEWCMN